MTLTLGFSPCPNDCFMFDALVHGRIDVEGLSFDVRMDDVEALNRAAFAGAVDVTKLSYHAYAGCADRFALLDAGSALGRGCGPLLIAKRAITPAEVAAGGLRIAIPGRYTTANLLLGLAFPKATRTLEMIFSAIEDAVLGGDADAGVIIHENRFTYEARGLRKVIDLGDYWEQETGAPIPLGAIAINRALPVAVQHSVNRVLRRSVEYAFAHPQASRPFVREHAQAMDEAVMAQHIALYVNEFSVDLGAEGRRAVETLFSRAAAAGVIAPPSVPLFITAATASDVPQPH
jgi:1,4-dihydroxy-6-naphthoate synthase